MEAVDSGGTVQSESSVWSPSRELRTRKAGIATSPARRLAEEALSRLSERVLVVESEGPRLDDALRAIHAANTVAVDCEGVRLSRTGQLTVLQVATCRNYFLFDVQALGSVVFTGDPDRGVAGLKSILEDATRTKLMFDCRVDSDALYHQFGIALAGVVDLQLLSVAVDRLAGDSVDFLPGFARCARRWLGNSTMRVVSALKKRIVELYEDDTADDALWGRRPLPVDVVRYAAADVALQAALQAAMWEKVVELEDVAVDGKERAGAEGGVTGAALHAQLLARVVAASAKRVLEYRSLEKAHTQDATHNDAAKAPTI